MLRPQFTLLIVVAVQVLGAAAAPSAEPIKPSSQLPKTTPWNLAALSEPPAFEWIDESGPVRSLLYAGEPFQEKPTRVFAYYATPQTLAGKPPSDQKLPAVVLLHGGGGTAFRQWAELWAQRGYAAIAMDLAGSRPLEGKDAAKAENRERLADGGPNQGDDTKFHAIDKPVTEQWTYHAVATAIRAHSLIRSFPEVDPARTAVTGISWGGYLTCIVAGVDSRFRAAVPVYGCGFLHENSVWLDRFAKMTPADRARWISLWDPSQYLPAVSMPILFMNGTNDNAYPLDSYMKSFDAVPGTKQIRITVNMPHSHPAGWAPQEIGLFVDHYLRGDAALPVVDEPQISGDKVQLKWRSPKQIKSASLHRTTDTGPINKRTWQTSAAAIDGNVISALLPATDTTAWFITAADERGAIVSTRVAIVDKLASAWRQIPLIQNGKVADGWSHIGWGSMVVDGDSLRTECDERGMGLLVYTRERLGNCEIRIVYRSANAKSNAGVYIRMDDGILNWPNKESIAVKREANGKLSPEMLKKLMEAAEAEQGVWYAVHHGYEVQIMDDADAAHRTGAIYGLAKAAALPESPQDGWRTMVISLDGSRVTVDIDGQRVSSFDSDRIEPPAKRRWTEPKLDQKRPQVGYLGLQNHDPGDVVYFKEVSVRQLDAVR